MEIIGRAKMPSLIPLSIILLLSYLLHPSPVSGSLCNKDDKKVLLVIKKELADPDLTNAWTSQFACCDWYGVECDPVSGRVVNLYMDGSNSPFLLPPSVAKLTFITSLTFHKNPGLTGPIPPAIGAMTQLTFLRLDWNSLSGPVPDFLARLTKLEYLNLRFNQFSGSIPPSLADLPLGYIALDRNRLTGPIPASFARLPSASYLYLSHNNLTGPIPPSFAENKFEIIDVSRNQLSGDASHLFGVERPLQRLDLSRNRFEFDMTKVRIPANMAALDMNHNRIFGRLPAELSNFEWQVLNVSYNRLCGPIPTSERIRIEFDQYDFLHNKCLCGPPLPISCK